MKLYFEIILFFLISTFVFADNYNENKKKFGGPKSDYVLERKKFNFQTAVKNNGNWVLSKKTGEIVRWKFED